MRPNINAILRPLESKAEEDEIMREDHANADAGEPSAVKTTNRPMKPSDQDTASPKACGHYPHRDWYRACVGGAGRSDYHKRQQERATRDSRKEHGLRILH